MHADTITAVHRIARQAYRTIASEAYANDEAIAQATAERVRRAVEDIVSVSTPPRWHERATQATIRVMEDRADVRPYWWAGRRPWRHRSIA